MGLRIPDARCEIAVAGRTVAEGARAGTFTIPARYTVTVGFAPGLAVVVAFAVVPQVLSDTVVYRISSSCWLRGLLGPRTVRLGGELGLSIGAEFRSVLHQALGESGR